MSFRRVLSFLALALAIGVFTACSSTASTRQPSGSSGPTTTAQQVQLTSVPAGTTLRVGDQLDYLKTILGLAGEDQDFPYTVKYSAFIGGPPMLQAFQGGAIDTGFVGSTPLIFAQASGQDLKAVAGWTSDIASYGLVTAPGVTDIHSWGDLKGKKVAYQEGTAGEAVLLEALDSAGLTLSDVTSINVVQTQVNATLQGGSADAGVQVEPLTSVYLKDNPSAAQVDKATEITDRSFFLIAAKSTLDKEAKQAALADYLARLVRAMAYLADHPEQVAKAIFVDTYGLTPQRANELVKQGGGTKFLTLPDEILAPQQRLADLFVANKEIPQPVDVAQEFDLRFATLIQHEAAK